jgi:hypothetical protein
MDHVTHGISTHRISIGIDTSIASLVRNAKPDSIKLTILAIQASAIILTALINFALFSNWMS